ncbi:MAG TPA: methylated-DNA--[protein]-cysteine S-methyltransferase [Woeseiaceae bacterium]|nr:methylated-DNA--[protein]-cysteine S-methyltransferase [Woeseiaceae bacterium]
MQRNKITHYTTLNTIIGELLIAGNSRGVSLIQFPREYETHEIDPNWQYSKTYFSETVAQLQQYFKGELKQFSVPAHFSGTKFQIAVISALQTIPYGTTCSYADLAKIIGHPRAYRAVGSANGINPLPIIYPCHRVIASDGSIGGFSSDLRIKKTLLNLEANFLAIGKKDI